MLVDIETLFYFLESIWWACWSREINSHQPSEFDIHLKSESWLPAQNSLIHSIYSLLSVQPFSLSEIQATFYISLKYHSSFYLLQNNE